MQSDLKRKLALLILALGLPLAASADVTYSYTGQNFAVADAVLSSMEIEFTPEQILAFESDLKAGLLASSLTMSITLPVYLPSGWSSFSNNAILPSPLLDSLNLLKNTQTLADPTVSFDAEASPQLGLFVGGGSVATDGPRGFSTSVFSVLVHADANHAIDAWNIEVRPWVSGDTILLQSAAGGDYLSFDSVRRAGAVHYVASNATAGDWAMSGTAVTAVPEPAGYGMLLGGLGLMGWASRRRRV